jgi:hypothetical protein
MDKLFDVEVVVTQTRRYKNIPASNAGTAEAVVAELVEEDPKGMDSDVEYDVFDSISEDVTAYASENE